MIWTTAWTIPANQALNLNPELPYSLVETERGLYVMAETLVDACMERWGLRRHEVLATVPGEKLGGIGLNTRCTTWPVRRPMATAACRPVPGRLRHGHRRHWVSCLVARLRRGRLQLVRGARHEVRRHPEPGAGAAPYAADFPLFGGQHIWKAIPVIIGRCATRAA